MLRVDSIQHTVHVLITTTGVSFTSTKKLILKKSSRFGENIINQMCRDGIIPQFANIVSMQCYSTYKNR